MKQETNKVLAFLDICINDKDPSCLLNAVHRKGICKVLLINFFGFTSFSYKICLTRTFIDNNSLAKFSDNAQKLYYIFTNNRYSKGLINRVIRSYLDVVHNSNTSTPQKDTYIIYFSLPFLNLSNFAQHKVCMLVKRYCKDLQIKLAFASLKIKNLIKAKDCVLRSLHSNTVYRFTLCRM